MTFDDIRLARPDLGLAVYALDPGGPVILEVHFEGDVFTYRGASEAEVFDAAFPPPSEPEVDFLS